MSDPIPTYRIRDWDKHYENSESRKIKSLRWVSVPNKHDGKGYRRLAVHPKSIRLFCAWSLIVQVASKMPVRGVLADDDGACSPSDLSFKTGFPEDIFKEAFHVFTDPGEKILWLEVVKKVESVLKLPDGPGDCPGPPGSPGVEGKGMELNGRGGECPDARAGSDASIPTLAEVVKFAASCSVLPDKCPPADYCADWYAKNNEDHRWEKNGRLIDWKSKLPRYWSQDAAGWAAKKLRTREISGQPKTEVHHSIRDAERLIAQAEKAEAERLKRKL